MKDIVIDGKKYQKATEVAEHLGYTSDYVGQLCRSGKIDAQQIGRSWYVVPESIHTHKKTRYRSNQAKSKAAVAEYKEARKRQLHTAKTKDVTRHVPVHHYEHDSAELIPGKRDKHEHRSSVQEDVQAARQLEVEASGSHRKYKPADKEAVKFKGSLEVASAEAPIEPETQPEQTPAGATVIHPRVVTDPTPSNTPRRKRVAVTQDVVSDRAVAVTRRTRKPKRSWVMGVAIRLVQVSVVCILAVVALGMRVDYRYDGASVTESVSFDYDEITDFVNKYIVILFKQEY